MRFNSQSKRHAAGGALLSLLLLVICVGAAQAQSGRRPPKPQEIAPVPQPSPTPVAAKPAEPEKKIPLTVLGSEPFTHWSMTYSAEAAMAIVGARLREARALDVGGGRKANRSEAIKQAKAEKERHVVWLEVRTDAGAEMRARRPSPEYFHIEYFVYEPVTAKVKASGRVYLRSYGGIRLPPTCYPAITGDYEFILAAVETADRIIKSFSLPLPPKCA